MLVRCQGCDQLFEINQQQLAHYARGERVFHARSCCLRYWAQQKAHARTPRRPVQKRYISYEEAYELAKADRQGGHAISYLEAYRRLRERRADPDRG